MDTQQLGNAFDELPYKIKDWLSSLKVFSAVDELIQKFNLDYEQERAIPFSVLRLCVKDLPPLQFMGEIRNQLRVGPVAAREITSLIHEKILVPIKSDLEELGVDVNLIFQGKISEQLPPPPPPPLSMPKTVAEARPFILHEETSWVAPTAPKTVIAPIKTPTPPAGESTQTTSTVPVKPLAPPQPPLPKPPLLQEKTFLPPGDIHEKEKVSVPAPKLVTEPLKPKEQIIVLKPATPKIPASKTETPMRVVNYSGPRTPLTPAPPKKTEPKSEPTVDLRKMTKPNPNEIDLRQKTK